MRGYAELLGEATHAEQQVYLGRIAELSERIAAMIRELGDRDDRAVVSAYDPEPLRIGELVEAVRGRLRVGFELSRLVSGLHAVDMHADRVAMERVLANVVGDALEYSEAGPVALLSEQTPGRVRITVTDQGRGIEPDDLALVLDEFQRGRLATPAGGSGLGSSGARRLVEQQGGSITVTSTLTVSTTIAIDLPAAGPASPPAPQPTVPPPSPAAPRLRAA